MPEATIVLFDNSSYALNTDYSPSRLEASMDLVKTLFNHNVNSNPENQLGVVLMAPSPTVVISGTQQFAAILQGMKDVQPGGSIDLVTSINIAQLALKHRSNKTLRQRIIALVGSPLESTSSTELVKLAKKLKKNSVAADIVSFGETEGNDDKLREFIEAVNTQENSHFVSVPAGTGLLSDVVRSSAILGETGDAHGAGPSTNAENGDDQGGLDPELEMALRLSLQDEQARQSASTSASQPATSEQPSAATANTSLPPDLSEVAATGPAAAPAVNTLPSEASSGPSQPAVKAEEADVAMESNEDDELAAALALSRGDRGGEDTETSESDEALMTEDEEIARAIALSMREPEKDSK